MNCNASAFLPISHATRLFFAARAPSVEPRQSRTPLMAQLPLGSTPADETPNTNSSSAGKKGDDANASDLEGRPLQNPFDNPLAARIREINEAEFALCNPARLDMSHTRVIFDSDGAATLDRFVYVEERDCIGCTHCATTATGTFFLKEEDGRARVFDQHGDSEEMVEEAIDMCPVNCIYYVDWADLIKLETFREGQQINNSARLVGGQDFSSSRMNLTAGTAVGSDMIRCSNCPSRGCQECPMYGVGLNPEYMRKKKAREARRRARSNRDRGDGPKRRAM